jgi:hypothetical protein
MDKCGQRSSLVNANSCYYPGMKKPTRMELLEKLGPDILGKVEEVTNQPKADKDREKKQIESALKTLAKRIKPRPVPVPRSVWDSMMTSFGAAAAAHKEFPNLNAATKKALIKMACPYDGHPEEWMLELGNYLVGAFTSNEMVGFIRDLGHCKKNPSKLSLPNRVAQLAYDLIEDASECTGFHSYKHTADTLLYLSEDEIKQEAELAGLDGSGTKGEVVVRLIELFYADVLVPSPAE